MSNRLLVESGKRLFFRGRLVSFQSIDSSFVVGFVSDFGHEFGMYNLSRFVNDDYGTGQQGGQGPVDHLHTIFFGKLGGTEGRGGDEVLDAFGGAEPRLGKGQVFRYGDDRRVVERGRQLVEFAYRCGAHRRVEAGEDIQDDASSRQCFAAQFG